MDDLLLYSRQQTLSLDVPEKAAIVGCGGVGAWAALFLTMSGTKEIVLIDNDVIEFHNLNRLPFSTDMVGETKPYALNRLIRTVRPSCKTTLIERCATKEDLETLKEKGYIVIDCTDNLEAQHMTAEADPKRIRAGYDGGLSITITDGPPPGWVGVETTGYQITPSWVVGASIAGALAVAKACKFKDAKVTVDIDELMQG